MPEGIRGEAPKTLSENVCPEEVRRWRLDLMTGKRITQVAERRHINASEKEKGRVLETVSGPRGIQPLLCGGSA